MICHLGLGDYKAIYYLIAEAPKYLVLTTTTRAYFPLLFSRGGASSTAELKSILVLHFREIFPCHAINLPSININAHLPTNYQQSVDKE